MIRQHGLLPWQAIDELRFVGDSETGAVFEHEGMMIAVPPQQWQLFAQLDGDTTVQFLQHLAAQMELSKFRSHPRAEQKKVPKPERRKDKPHVSTARLLSEAKSKKAKNAP